MVKHRRGQKTRQRILEEACNVFGEKGFRDATHVEICKKAGTNVAAINYYFGSKESLYRAVFEYLSARAEELYPFDEDLPPETSPELHLHAFVRAFLRRAFDPERLRHLHSLRMAEMFDPTGHLDEVMEQWLSRDRSHILGILRRLAGPHVSQRDLEWCEMSIVGQCMMVTHGSREEMHKDIFGISEAGVDLLARHIYEFSLAGVEAIARNSRGNADGTESPAGTHRNRLGTDDECTEE